MMKKLTDLELCTKVADNYCKHRLSHKICVDNLMGLLKNNRHTNGKALLLDLMIKYKVNKHQHKINLDMCMVGIGNNFIVATGETILRAVLEVIVEANNA